MSKKDKSLLNPFLNDDGKIKTVKEPYRYVLFQKKILGVLQDVGHTIKDENFDNFNFNPDVIKDFNTKNTSPCSKTVMLYILSSLSKDQDSIYLNPKDISESSGYAKSAINLSLNELEANEFIKRVGGRGNKYQFWLNPFKIFKGKRIEYFKEFKEDAIKMLPGYTVTLD